MWQLLLLRVSGQEVAQDDGGAEHEDVAVGTQRDELQERKPCCEVDA